MKTVKLIDGVSYTFLPSFFWEGIVKLLESDPKIKYRMMDPTSCPIEDSLPICVFRGRTIHGHVVCVESNLAEHDLLHLVEEEVEAVKVED